MKVEWSDLAFSGLRAIAEYIEQDRGIETANRISEAIFDAVQSLATMPWRGREGMMNNTREMVIPGLPYIVVYMIIQDRVAIVNIIHGARQRP